MINIIFNNFTNIYALFAGLSSALIGIYEIRTFIEKTLKGKFNIIYEQLNMHIEQQNSLHNQYKTILSSIMQNGSDDYIELEKLIKSLRKKKNKLKTLFVSKEKINKLKEVRYNQKKITALHVFGFFFSLFMLLITGLVDSNILTQSFSLKLIGNLEIFSFLAFICIIIFVRRTSSFSGLIFSFILFICIVFFSFLVTFFYFGYFNTNEKVMLIISLLLGAAPLCILVCSTYLKYSCLELFYKGKICFNDYILKRESKKIGSVYLDLIQ